MNDKKTFLNFFLESSISRILIAILLGFAVGTIFLIFSGFSVVETYTTLLNSAFRNAKSISYCFVYASPYILTGLSIAFAYKSGIFNLGAEGQFVMGSIAACVVGIIFADLPKYILVPFCFVVAMLSGALIALVVGFLKIKFGINEILSMIMFNWVAFYFSNYIAELPLIKSTGNAQTTKNISDNARILLNSDLIKRMGFCNKANYGIFIALFCAILIYVVIRKTVIGYKFRMVGYSKTAAEYAGVNVKKYMMSSIAIAGLLSGLAGAVQLMGMGKRVSIFTAQEGFGFGGIVVALIGVCNPIGVFFSGIFYGTLKFAGRSLNLIGVPTQVIDVIVGTVIFFISISSIFAYTKYIKKIKKEKKVLSNG